VCVRGRSVKKMWELGVESAWECLSSAWFSLMTIVNTIS